jgi:hypothetical protein
VLARAWEEKGWLFKGASEAMGECELRLEGREDELRGRAGAAGLHRRRWRAARRGSRPGGWRCATHGGTPTQVHFLRRGAGGDDGLPRAAASRKGGPDDEMSRAGAACRRESAIQSTQSSRRI